MRSTRRARVPAPMATLVERPRLVGRLSEAVEAAPLTLVSAAAGSGKTVLAARWADGAARLPLAWVKATDRDNDPAAFWWHVRSALHDAGLSGASRTLYPGADDAEVLGEELLRQGRSVVLVLDAADRLGAGELFDGLAALIDRAEGLLRVLMTTRHEPPLPLHRYRLEGTVVELDEAELAFTGAEIKELLEHHDVSSADTVADQVADQTAGWAAGVRMAALALRSSSDRRALQELAHDYLRAEVFDALTEDERHLLLRVSIVDEVMPELAQALSGRANAESLLRELSRQHAFIQSAEDRPGCYRIHPLFREFLRTQHTLTDADANELHRTAAEWFGAHGVLLPAVTHALAAGDAELAAGWAIRLDGLVEILASAPGGTALVERMQGLPISDAVDVRLIQLALALGRGDLDAAREHVAGYRLEAELHLDDERLLYAAVLFARLGELTGDVQATRAAADRARRSLAAMGSQTDSRWAVPMALVTCSEATACLEAGDLGTAAAMFEDAASAAAAHGRHDVSIRCLALLALTHASSGQLSRARDVADAAQRAADEHRVDRPAALELARGWVALERQDLAHANQALARPGNAEDRLGAPVLHSISGLLRVRLKRDHGHTTSARRLLQDAETYDGWLRGYFDQEAEALGLLACLAELPAGGTRSAGEGRAETPATTSRQVDLLLEHARICAIRGETRASRLAVAEALGMARGERLRRPFVHAAPELRAMVRRDPELRSLGDWLRPEQNAAAPEHGRRTERVPVVEELSQRELEVLRHLSALLTTEEIAAELFISANTVRTHVRRILGKLSVSRRHEAVRLGRELGLI